MDKSITTWGFRLFRDDTPNLPTILKAAGYRTVLLEAHINPVDSFSFDFMRTKGANFHERTWATIRLLQNNLSAQVNFFFL